MRKAAIWMLAVLWAISQGMPCCCAILALEGHHFQAQASVASPVPGSGEHACCVKSQPAENPVASSPAGGLQSGSSSHPGCCQGPAITEKANAPAPAGALSDFFFTSPVFYPAQQGIALPSRVLSGLTAPAEIFHGPPRYLVTRRILC